jgi:hypothetical protein
MSCVNSTNNCIQLNVINIIFFAKAKKMPLITLADAGVINLGEIYARQKKNSTAYRL